MNVDSRSREALLVEVQELRIRQEEVEAALHASEERFRLAFETANDVIYEWDLRQSVQWLGRIDELLGYGPGEFPRTLEGWAASVHPDDIQRTMAAVQAHLEGRAPYAAEYRVRRKDGTYRWWSARGAAARTPEGTPIRWIGTITDISEQKWAEEQARENEDRLRFALEVIETGDWDLDLIDHSAHRSLRHDQIFGYETQLPRWTYEMFLEHVVPEDRATVDQKFRQAMESKGDWRFECRIVRRDGQERWILASGRHRFDPAGQPRRMAGIVRDITERKRTEAALRESESRFRQLAESLPQLIWTCQPDGRCDFLNRQWLEFTGVPEAQQLGFGWLEQLHPEDRGPTVAAWEAAVASGGGFRVDFRIRRHDGEYRWFDTQALRLHDAEGHTVKWFGSNTDVTARKWAEAEIRQLNAELEQRVIERTAQLEASNGELRQREAELKSLFESLPGLYLVLTPGLRIVAASDAYLEATLTTREGIVGRYLFDIFPDNPDDPGTKAVAAMQASVDRVLRTRAPDTMPISKHDVRGPDGAFVERYWSPINSPMLGADQQIKYLLHRVEEVTEFMQRGLRPAVDPAERSPRMEQMEAEIFQSAQRVKAANQQLEAANKELESFSYSVSHDLRAPLRHLSGFVELLNQRETSLDDKSRHYLQVIAGAASQMGRLIDDLLAFSRMGRAEFMRSRVDLRVILDETILELKAETKDRIIHWDIKDLPVVSGDWAMLKLVFVNLLMNALKFTLPRAQASIEISSIRTDGEVIISVKDNGVGFHMKHSDKLFNLFQRLHRAEEFEGTGLGLANVRRIIHRHGGRTWAHGELDSGATFYFTLPHDKET